MCDWNKEEMTAAGNKRSFARNRGISRDKLAFWKCKVTLRANRYNEMFPIEYLVSYLEGSICQTYVTIEKC